MSVITEKVTYYTRSKRMVRSAAPHQLVLLSIKYPDKDNRAILPLADDKVDAFRESPFYSVLVGDTESGFEESLQTGFYDTTSQLASNLMGPGPWVLQFDAKIPATCHYLHPTNSNKDSNMTVSHVLKIVYRVERGDSEYVDARGKRKQFDIVIQSPIHILSVGFSPHLPIIFIRS
jgi:arrestin-related trafficking adapter 3/6